MIKFGIVKGWLISELNSFTNKSYQSDDTMAEQVRNDDRLLSFIKQFLLDLQCYTNV